MKKTLLFSAFLVAIMLFDVAAQNAVYQSGKIELTLRTYGRVRIGMMNNGAYVRQLDRASLLYNMQDTATFDYLEDADDEILPDTVDNPTWGDVELTSRINSDYSNQSPLLKADIHLYGWANKGYAIVKYVVKSQETAAYQGRFGLEMIPQVEGAYGNEIMTYDPAKWLFSFSKTNYFGLKILNLQVPSAHNFEWYEGYNVDTSLTRWMTDGQYENFHWAGIDGGTAVFGTSPVATNPNDSTIMYIAIAVGLDSLEMNANIDSATAKYNQLTGILDETPVASITDYKMYQNYPNPFNPSTKIVFDVPQASNVNLSVYDLLGNKVAELVNGYQNAGRQSVNFDASKLSSGVYFYTLRAGATVITNKMILSK
ncbi:MAG: T9SS type A sorting domain-containing protein [Bacteroidetes bacterium]|nr:T9SS type A sorting domain-containing protein [Bacteroidota bacterium]